MAESVNLSRRIIISDAKILVNVDHASEELLVVSYSFKKKLFQGILIDSTNRYLPCGYPSPEVVKWSPPRVTDPPPTGAEPSPDTNRPFYSLSNRFTYFQDVLFQKNIALVKSAKQAKAKAQKMTVRLRPRQVLCSKCRSICNENSENVHSSSNNKKDAKTENSSSNVKNLLTESVSNENQNSEIKSPRKKVRTTLVPKLSRLEPEDGKTVNGSQLEAGKVWSEMLEADKQMVLRKKRSVGSMEDLWDETVFEEASKKAKTTPIIKISFGSPGEGTVLKIPSKVQLSGSEGEDEEEKEITESSKSFKKAMKKAKKEAKRKISPERDEDPSPEEPNYKKHRHRVKHKKRHKNSKEEEMKDKCLKQKLSISLRRVCGPGEEESWSGESSRSSEPIKDLDETKSEFTLQESSRLPCEDTQDCKENLRAVVIDSEELPKKNKKVISIKRKKIPDVENTFKNHPSKRTQRLEAIILKQKHTSERLLKSNQSHKTTEGPVKIVLTSFNTDDSRSFPGSSSGLKNDDVKPEKVKKEFTVCKTEYIPTSRKISGPLVEDMKKVDKLRKTCDKLILQSKIKLSRTHSPDLTTFDSVLSENTSDAVTDFPNTSSCGASKELTCIQKNDTISDHLSSIQKNKSGIEQPSDLDDMLDDLQGSEDSMPELEDTVEDALLESDKETSEGSSKQRRNLVGIPLDRDDEPEREIPVLQRMVDVEHEIELKSRSSDIKKSYYMSPLLSPIFAPSTKNQSENMDNVSPSLESSAVEESEDTHPILSPNLESALVDLELSGNIPTLSDDLLDSSGESEFLPAEDSFDCPHLEEISKHPPSTDHLVCSNIQINANPNCLRSVDKDITDSQIIRPFCESTNETSRDSLLPKESGYYEPLVKSETDEISNDSLIETSELSCSVSKDVPAVETASKAQIFSLSNSQNIKVGCESLRGKLNSPSIACSSNSNSTEISLTDCFSREHRSSTTRSQRRLQPVKGSDVGTDSDEENILGCKVLKMSQDILSENGNSIQDSLKTKIKKTSSTVIDSSKLQSSGGSPKHDPPNSQSASGCLPSLSVTIKSPNHSDSSQDILQPKTQPSRTLSPDLTTFDSTLSDDTSDAVPNFPNSSPRGAPQDVTSCQTVDGSVLTVGDIVWAKIHGFPWWPAKVVRLCMSGNGSSTCDARVAWFGSATSSLMSTDQLSPFIQTFKARYNRERKSTGYLEAIRQATNEARDFNFPQPLAEIDKLLAL